ncbi:MAG: transcriptional regulator [Eubacteriales bacterium]|nr:transcriptional regulator [Eubacteriales bacterium]
MSYKFDSLLIIQNKLDSGAKVTADSLREELEVSKRTVHRYISTLQTANFPIDYDRNNKTYAFVGGYTLKRPNLSVEETLAFSLARKMLDNFGPGMDKSLGSIEKKLTVAHSPGLKHIVLSPETVPAGTERYLAPIHRAIINYQRIEMAYKAFAAKKATPGTVDPHYLFFQNGIWYFRGYYHGDKAARTFALDRIESLSILDRHFLPPDLEPEAELSGAFGAFIDGDPVDVILRFDEVYKPLILRKIWHTSQKQRELANGRVEVTFRVNGILGIRNWVYQWIPHVEVVEPKELRDIFLDDLENAMKKHGRKK